MYDMYVLYGIGQTKTCNKLASYYRTICEIMIFEMKKIKTRSHPEIVGDMSRVTLNFGLSKIPFVHF